MIENQFQDDFFDPGVSRERKRSGFVTRYPAVRFMPHVRIPVEYVVVLGIVMLVLLIVAYAAGVERGKNIVMEPRPTDIVAVGTMLELTGDADNTEILGQDEETPEEARAEEESASEIEPAQESQKPRKSAISGEKTVAKPEEAAYTIQLAALAKKENVERETAKLKEAGNDAAYVKIGKWYQVYVKGYRTIGEARSAKVKFTEEYPDCYIRKQ